MTIWPFLQLVNIFFAFCIFIAMMTLFYYFNYSELYTKMIIVTVSQKERASQIFCIYNNGYSSSQVWLWQCTTSHQHNDVLFLVIDHILIQLIFNFRDILLYLFFTMIITMVFEFWLYVLYFHYFSDEDVTPFSFRMSPKPTLNRKKRKFHVMDIFIKIWYLFMSHSFGSFFSLACKQQKYYIIAWLQWGPELVQKHHCYTECDVGFTLISIFFI